MTADERVSSLLSKHAAIDHAIDEENQRPHPDDLRIHELKREKLRIKDEIAGHDSHA
ncbi:YdcH family protein [Pelagibius sp.]|uniref:YdcH family protein n=1 Tax=Pelagibius sp. TaxID=1931238 RepID=UPI003BB00FEB